MTLENQPPEVTYLKAEENYNRTGDIRYIVLAIGAYPNNTPEWAIKASREYFLQSKNKNFTDLKTKRGPKPFEKDYKKLDSMCKLIASGVSINAAASKVTGNDANKESDMKRLIRLYKSEEYLDGNILQGSKRLETAIVERVKSGKWGKQET